MVWGRLFSPSLSCRGQGIGKQRGTTSSWHKRTAGRNLVSTRGASSWYNAPGKCPEVPLSAVFFSLFSHSDIKAGKLALLVPPSTKTKKTLGDRAFTAAAPSLWNKLPSAIRDEDNLKRFKSKLKTFLFRVAYNTNSF